MMVLEEPARAEAELEKAAAHVVEGRRRLGGERRMAERVAGDELGELDPPRDHGERGEQRKALEQRVVGRFHGAAHEEVVGRGDRVVPGRLGTLRELAHLGEGTPRQLDAEARPSHGAFRARRGAGRGAGCPTEAWSTR